MQALLLRPKTQDVIFQKNSCSTVFNSVFPIISDFFIGHYVG